jgi:hypothetical protein
MIILDIIIDGKRNRVRQSASPEESLYVSAIRKAVENTFKEVEKQFPNDIIKLVWDADKKEFTYSSDTIPKETIQSLMIVVKTLDNLYR